MSSQIRILKRQIDAERLSLEAHSARLATLAAEHSEQSPIEAHLPVAVQTVHQRVLEGFFSWCKHAGHRRIDAQAGRQVRWRDRNPANARPSSGDMPLMFAECVLHRTLESLAEHILNCPERISYIFHRILKEAEEAHTRGAQLDGRRIYDVDLDLLQDGLARMMANSDPFTSTDVSWDNHASFEEQFKEGRLERGLNFDDINESGLQRRHRVTKTFKEPHSVFVLVDFVLCYRVMFIAKMWGLLIASYLYLGSGYGRDVTTKYNGSILQPQYQRLDFIHLAVLLDAVVWCVMDIMVPLVTIAQRWPSWGKHSPGAPNLRWLLQRLVSIGLAVILGSALWIDAKTQWQGRRPECMTRCSGDCMDPRVSHDGVYDSSMLLGIMKAPLLYWLIRLLVFLWLHLRRRPVLIDGTPDRQEDTKCWRFRAWDFREDLKLAITWLLMLTLCVIFEAYLLLPATAGLDWDEKCGFSLLPASWRVEQRVPGVCTASTVNSSCVPCVVSIIIVWMLVAISTLLDVYFVFYVFSAVVGFTQGSFRELNDLKNPHRVIDLRYEHGKDFKLLENSFGENWQDLWRRIIEDLVEESLIGMKQQAFKLARVADVSRLKVRKVQRGTEEALGLAKAVEVEVDVVADGSSGSTVVFETPNREVDLGRDLADCELAQERLAFFFKSLHWIDQKCQEKSFNTRTDALTSEDFHPGSVPPLTMIIPAYNEVVIPSVDFLKAGNELKDARNQAGPNGECGLPPKGDGLHTNLAFIISQFTKEWAFLAERYNTDGKTLYKIFMEGRNLDLQKDVRMWAAFRTQSVAKTVLGALKYQRALKSLVKSSPKLQEWYNRERRTCPGLRIPELHTELLLAHQTYGSQKGNKVNDEAVRMLLKDNQDLPFYLVFDFNPATKPLTRVVVEKFIVSTMGPAAREFIKFARCKCAWDPDAPGGDIKVVEILPRFFKLRLGSHNDFMTQGKASNQLNALVFATGHCVQAMDCNMGTFIGECYKVPYVLREFLPPPLEGQPLNRLDVRARYIGFREFIFTSREGAVGHRHAAAEWTFGTIYQRFLSFLSTRMHYGHPDFIDGFWARNRGGMSKCSPVVNLSEDIFAGYNVRMREENSPHVDVLEFEKGREATINAASNFFSKIAGGSVAIVRSRDNHLLCERLGILRGLNFYFASVAFYVSNVLVDISTYLYVLLFVCFTLSSISLGDLKELNSALGTEWIISMGLFSMVPQLMELVLEYGAWKAIKDIVLGFVSSTIFFIFQNKNMASAIKQGVVTGAAKYFFTGRPIANQHITWQDLHRNYWKSHYHPAFELLTYYIVYVALAKQNADGVLPMTLVAISFTTWIAGPLLFSPFPRWELICEEMRDFYKFINGKGVDDIDGVLKDAAEGKCRNLHELSLADEISKWTGRSTSYIMLSVLLRLFLVAVLIAMLPAGILDFTWTFFFALGLQWLLMVVYFVRNYDNCSMFLSMALWFSPLLGGFLVIGERARNPSVGARLTEYLIATIVYFVVVGLLKRIAICVASGILWLSARCCGQGDRVARRRFTKFVHLCHFFFFEHQKGTIKALLVLCVNVVASFLLLVLDAPWWRLHSWWLLNFEIARAKARPLNPEEALVSFGDSSRAESRGFLPGTRTPSRPSSRNASFNPQDASGGGVLPPRQRAQDVQGGRVLGNEMSSTSHLVRSTF